ncbi:AEC family transporter [Yoonia sp. MH D7]
MTALLDVILPVFIVIGFGYTSVWSGYFSDALADGLMKFTQGFAIPCLLFLAISTLDLGQHFNFALLFSYYAGVILCFFIGLIGARLIFKRDWEDCVVIGFVGMFSNSVLLGVPITERAYGGDALAANFAIIALNAPICYALGITAMEVVRNQGRSLVALPAKVFKAVFKNALIVAIGGGFLVNLTGITLPAAFSEAVTLISRAALPAALFGLGGVLFRYKPDGDMLTIMFVVVIALIIHPAITFGLAKVFNLSTNEIRSAVITGAMAPGVNAYLFADMYGRARRVAASAVLIATGLTVITAWGWLAILP